jgi:hypothetical protein
MIGADEAAQSEDDAAFVLAQNTYRAREDEDQDYRGDYYGRADTS